MKRLGLHFPLAALIAAGTLAGAVSAQQPVDAHPPGCPASALDLPLEALSGRWEARIEGQPGVAPVQLGPHPDYPGVRGSIEHAGQSAAQLAGDLDDEGVLSIDESRDGRSISASWTARMAPGSCGRVFKGSWRDAADEDEHPLELRRDGAW